MRALVTGSSGFVGRHIAAVLARRGWQVRHCDLLDDASWYSPDARDIYSTCDSVHDLVVHCAYHVGGRAGIDGEPVNLIRNVQLDSMLFEWALRTGQRAVIYYSSSAVYPVRLQQTIPVTVDEARRYANGARTLSEPDVDLDQADEPDARYGWAKLTGERMAAAAADLGLRVHVLRPFSGYGGDQGREYPFPAIVDRASRGDLSVWGPAGQVRDWVHIDDVVATSLAVYEADYRGPVNICSGEAVEFGDLARRVYRLSRGFEDGPAEPMVVRYDVDKPTGVQYRVGDPTLMRHFWQPRVSLDEGIARALAGQ